MINLKELKPMPQCSICQRNIGFLNFEYSCAICGHTICSDCRRKWYENRELFAHIYHTECYHRILHRNYLVVCMDCYPKMFRLNQQLNQAMIADVELVSVNYKGHKKYSKIDGAIESRFYRDRDAATKELKTIAAYWGCNMVVDVVLEKGVGEETSDSGHGTHKYTTWKCSGLAVRK